MRKGKKTLGKNRVVLYYQLWSSYVCGAPKFPKFMFSFSVVKMFRFELFLGDDA
jgi:hypothetical protein